MKEKTITDVIVEKGKEEAKLILKEATAEAKALESKIIEDAQKEANKIIGDAKVAADTILKAEAMSHDLEKRQALLVAKSEVMDEIFEATYQKIKSLSEKEFLSFIIKMLEKETYEGSEEIEVNQADFQLYEKLLPEINKELKTKFTLSKKSVDIDSGFLIIGEHYDLNFDFKEIIEQVRKGYETKLAEELFDK